MSDDGQTWRVRLLAHLDQQVAETEAIKFTATGEAINRASSKLFELNHMRPALSEKALVTDIH